MPCAAPLLGCKWAPALIGEGAGQLANGKALMCVSISTNTE